MKHSTGKPTKDEQRRFDAIIEIGCVACILEGIHQNPPQIHHIVEGRKRLGHTFTMGLCPWHHEGIVPSAFSQSDIYNSLGPSYALQPREFTQRYGTQRELLEFQNELINHYHKARDVDED